MWSWLVPPLMVAALALAAPARVAAAPMVQDDYTTANVATPMPIYVLANDSVDKIDASWTEPAHGTVESKILDTGEVLVYTGADGFVGRDSFTYTVTDRSGPVLTATVTVDVIDFVQATLPAFTCAPTDEICNLTDAAGLGAELRYGRGVAFADIDGDGWDDLFAADTDERARPDFGVSKFYHNDHDGTFHAFDVGVSPDDLFGTWGASFADYDNDGDEDVLIVNGGYSTRSYLAFYENRMSTEGRLVNATHAAGIDVANATPSRWWGVSWADFDNDGFLDVVVTRTIGTPLLFHNNGDRTFTEVAAAMGITLEFLPTGTAVTLGALGEDGKNPVWIDYDDDGYPDLYIAGIHKHAFYANQGGHGFVDVTAQVFDPPFPPNADFPPPSPVVFSAAAGDFDQDGADDLYLGRWTEPDLLLVRDLPKHFRQLRDAIGLNDVGTLTDNYAQPYENTMGLGVGDLFDDGFPDVYLGAGDPSHAAEGMLFCNDGSALTRCTSTLLAGASGPYRSRGHGVAFADIDHDGDTDMFVNLGGHGQYDIFSGRDTREKSALYVRRPASPPRTATITLEGTTSNRDAIGAHVRVTGSAVHYYTVRSTQGFQSQNGKDLVVTLGDAPSAGVDVRWPSGADSTSSVVVGDRVRLVEPGPRQEICGNCIDDDGDGLTDFEDPDCCAAGELMLAHVRLRAPGKAGPQLALAGRIDALQLASLSRSTDVFVQLRPLEGTDLLCARIPGAALKGRSRTRRFKDAKGAVLSARGIDTLVLHSRQRGGMLVQARGRQLGVTLPGAGMVQATVAFYDATAATAGRCMATAAMFRAAGRKGGLRFP